MQDKRAEGNLLIIKAQLGDEEIISYVMLNIQEMAYIITTSWMIMMYLVCAHHENGGGIE